LANYHFLRSLAIPAIFFLSIGIAFFSPNAAVASWVLLIVVDAVMWRLWKSRLRNDRDIAR
jgi:MFS superfamily sulfate permease-like transporter